MEPSESNASASDPESLSSLLAFAKEAEAGRAWPSDAELEEARKIVAAWEGWAADLERAALAADPDAPDAHEADEQSMLDTGIDRIRLDFDDDED